MPVRQGFRGPLGLPWQMLEPQPRANHMSGMAFARTAFWRQDTDDDETLRRKFWRKLTAVLTRIPFGEYLQTAKNCAFDRATPLAVKATLVGAIAYFVLPIDAIPDVMPILGFTDDAAVLTTALRLVASHVTPEHRTMAQEKLTAMTDAAR